MCGKYRVSAEEENIELREIITNIQQKHPDVPLQTGDIFPSQTAPAITSSGSELMAWGFPRGKSKTLVINARSETSAHLPMFREAMLSQHCLLPASLFYEWDTEKNIHRFMSASGKLLYMAGLYVPASPLPRFVILTRAADTQVSPFHNRMPCLMQSPEYRHAWLNGRHIGPGILQILPDYRLSVA